MSFAQEDEQDQQLDHKTKLIDSYTKTETNCLLNDKANQSTTNIKTQADALLLLKADITQLIDSCTKTESNNLLNSKVNQSTTYIKTETDNLIAQIDVGDIDLNSNYTKIKADKLLGDKIKATDLDNYVTLGTTYTITANKSFNNSCRFASSIDGMSTIPGSGEETNGGTKTFSSNVTALGLKKSDRDDTSVLFAGSGDMDISEIQTSFDLSNYYTKTQTYSQQKIDNSSSYKVDNAEYNGAAIVTARVYYTDYELVNQANHDANNDGKIDINEIYSIKIQYLKRNIILCV
ncbi:MAG: hypothetical protein EZS28_037513 [Streblomastix strix]|uniref:Uncharacterized protein n=1 Tax=Streblomastix strix TaxID=222440 RepID=A0A5J4U9V1_9EUKA|nr:MAG: hypothetical protein EZS28_037513 [Streblomastix strix]